MLLIIAPCLHSLTQAYSDNTVALVTTLLIILSIATHDYTYQNFNTDQFPNAPIESVSPTLPTSPLFLHVSPASILSLNAIVLASLLLSSRLPDPLSVVAFLLFTFTLFAGSPPLLIILQSYLPSFHAALTLFLAFMGWLCVTCHSPVLGYIFLCLVLLIVIIAPYAFLSLQSQKMEVYGPWDYDSRGEEGKENI